MNEWMEGLMNEWKTKRMIASNYEWMNEWRNDTYLRVILKLLLDPFEHAGRPLLGQVGVHQEQLGQALLRDVPIFRPTAFKL